MSRPENWYEHRYLARDAGRTNPGELSPTFREQEGPRHLIRSSDGHLARIQYARQFDCVLNCGFELGYNMPTWRKGGLPTDYTQRIKYIPNSTSCINSPPWTGQAYDQIGFGIFNHGLADDFLLPTIYRVHPDFRVGNEIFWISLVGLYFFQQEQENPMEPSGTYEYYDSYTNPNNTAGAQGADSFSWPNEWYGYGYFSVVWDPDGGDKTVTVTAVDGPAI